MRIIPDDTATFWTEADGCGYARGDTIEITDDEWDEIWNGYLKDCCFINDNLAWTKQPFKSFFQYLRELLELARRK